MDHYGKSNYKVLLGDPGTARKKTKTKKVASPNRSIGAYGVPAGNAYRNHKASVLSSAVVPSLQQHVVRRVDTTVKTKPSPVVGRDDTGSVVMSRRVAGRVVPKTDYILGSGTLHPYEEKDLLGVALEHGEVLSSRVRLTGLGIVLTGKEAIRVSVSLWFLSLQSPGADLTQIVHLDLQSTPENYHFVQKKLTAEFSSPGVVFLTIHVPDNISGEVSMHATIHHVSTLCDESLIFQKPGPENAEPVVPEPAPVVVQKKPTAGVPTLSKNLFGDFILGKTDNKIPIFGVKKTEEAAKDLVEQTNLTVLQQSSAPAPDAAAGRPVDEDLEFSEKNDQDIYRLLDTLREQHKKSKDSRS
ncbi:hypothetical protein EBZ80_05010 [bacterium]|nr:hypothetical protein [bacterium]